MMVGSEPKIVDFVVVVEMTASMIGHWEPIMKKFIRPALEYFCGKVLLEMDCVGNYGNGHFGYVYYNERNTMLDPPTSCCVLRSPALFIRQLESIEFSGGGAERCCFVTEGLARALKIFDDVSDKPSRDATKICILVGASPPFEVPCYDIREYYGRKYEDLAKEMHERNIHLSVIAPYLTKELRNIYRFANPSKSTMVNYGWDLKYLALISGFELPTEQTPVKVEQKEETATSSGQQAKLVPTLVSSSPNETAIVASTYISNAVATLPSQPIYSMPIPSTQPTSLGQPSYVKPEPMASVPVPPSSSTNFTPPSSFTENVPEKKPLLVPATTGIVPFPMPTDRRPQPITSTAPSSGVSQNSQAQREADTILEEANKQKPIWTGLLEWNEKRMAPTGGEERTVRQLNCEILRTRNGLDEHINTSCWPEKLTMQLVPRIVLNNEAVKPFLRQVPVVALKLAPHDQSEQLSRLMYLRWMGVINLNMSPSGIPQQGDSRVILVIHSPKNGGQMIGLVSRETNSLIQAIRQALKSRNPTQPPPQAVRRPGAMTNPGHFRPSVPGRMNEVQLPGMIGSQGRPMEYVQPQQINNPGQQVPQPNVVVSQNPGNPQQQRYPIIRHPSTMTRLPQQHPRLRAAHQQVQQAQITLNRPNHGGDNVRALLTGAGNNSVSQPMNQNMQQQRPGLVNSGMGQASNMGFMQTQQMRHPIGSRVMGMPQHRFNMQ